MSAASVSAMLDEIVSTSSEAARTDSDVLLIVLICIVFCLAVRHANDFYAGDTVTLVEEGLWGGRFRHRGDHSLLQNIEADDNNMSKKSKPTEKVDLRQKEVISYV